MATTLFPGVPVDIGGQIGLVVVPGLSIGQLERLQAEHGDEWTKSVSQFAVIKLALERNYSLWPDEVLKDCIDQTTMRELFSAVVNASGMKRTREGTSSPNLRASASSGAG